MKLSRRNFLHLAVGAAALPGVSRLAWAQTYPSRPVRIIVGYPPGGATNNRKPIGVRRRKDDLMTAIWHKRHAPFGVILSINPAVVLPSRKIIMCAWSSPQRFGEPTRRRAGPLFSPVDLTLQRPFDADAHYTPHQLARGQICVSQR